MASPLVAASSPRILDPHKKGHFNLQLSDKIMKTGNSSATFSSIKFNHKPQQTSQNRTATITPSAGHQYTLTLSDKDQDAETPNTHTYAGQRIRSKKSYVMIFDPAKQTCTLEPLSASYTFNLKSTSSEPSSAKFAQQYPQIQPPKGQGAADDTADLFDEDGKNGRGSDSEPDEANPYDYRHFLSQSRRGDAESAPSSPDALGGSGLSTPRSDFGRSTPLVQVRKAAATAAGSDTTTVRHPPKSGRRTAQPLTQPQRKRKSSPPTSTTGPGKKPNPAVRLDRRASTRITDPKPSTTTTTNTKSKLPKSAPLVHPSDDSDVDGDGSSDPDNAALTIEVPDADVPRHRRALASVNFNQTLGLGLLKSPSNGPISLHSAANSVSGSPDSRAVTPLHFQQRQKPYEDDDVIDFGDLGGGGRDDSDEEDEDEDAGYVEDDEDEMELVGDVEPDRDVEPMELGPPATTSHPPSVVAATRGQRMSVSGEVGLGLGGMGDSDGEDDEFADFEAEMMQGLVSQEEEERIAKGLVNNTADADSESESEEE